MSFQQENGGTHLNVEKIVGKAEKVKRKLGNFLTPFQVHNIIVWH